MRRVLSLWLPDFAIERHRKTQRTDGRSARLPERHGRPFALLRREGGRLLLAAVDPMAASTGLTPGQPFADARALCPELTVAEADPAGDAAALIRLSDWALRYTPWSAPDPWRTLGGGAGLWLDISGCAHLCGGEAALAEDLLARLRRCGFTGRLGLADTPGAAWAVAHYRATAHQPACLVPPGAQRTALEDLPVAALRLAPAQVELLARFGLTRIGQLLALPPATLVTRLGRQATERLRQATGEQAEAISPRRPVTAHGERLLFGEPIAATEDLARALERLTGALAHRLEREALGARQLALTLFRVDGSLQRCRLGTSRPSREPAHLRRLFAERLERLDPGFGIDAMALEATAVEPLSALQLTLGGGGAAAQTSLAGLLDRLAARLGAESVGRQWPRQSHLPERAVVRRPAPVTARDPQGWPSGPPRPLRLLTPPEPVEATALLPDHPPLQFCWRRILHRVARAEGPERLAPEWWRDGAASQETRDYFRVEDVEGRRFWLYRSGGHWFLQGLFG